MAKKPPYPDLLAKTFNPALFGNRFLAPDMGLPASGEPKGMGFLGLLQRPDGNYSSEISASFDNSVAHGADVPLMVPTLTRDEVETLLKTDINRPDLIPPSILEKAVAFARQREQEHKPYFAMPSESPEQTSKVTTPVGYRANDALVNPPIEDQSQDQGSLNSYTPSLTDKANNFLNTVLFGDTKEGQQKAEWWTNRAKAVGVAAATAAGHPEALLPFAAYDAGRDAGESKWGHAFLDTVLADLPGGKSIAGAAASAIAPKAMSFLASIAPAFIPKRSALSEFEALHGSSHDFPAIGNHPYGQFDPSKALSGEGTNYEGAGTYLTDKVAEPIATSYAHMGAYDPIPKIGNTTFDEIKKKFKEFEGMAGANTADKLFALDEIANAVGNKAQTLPNLNGIIDFITKSLPNEGADFYKTLHSLKDKPFSLTPPGGNIYDVLVHDNPDNFINMHMPLVHQDPKIQQGVQEWITHMPLSKHQNWLDIPFNNFSYKGNPRSALMRNLEDPHTVPYKIMTPVLGNEHSVEQANILKDFVPGQKWFSRHDNGSQRRAEIHQMFADLADAKHYANNTGDGTRAKLEYDLSKLQEQHDNLPFIKENEATFAKLNTQINRLNWKLSQLPTTDDIEARLWATYHNAPYNYVVNDPQNLTTITGKRFKPK